MEAKSSNDLYKTKYYTLTNFLQFHTNNSEDYEDVKYYEPCLISSEKETKAFKYLIIEKEDISFCENPPKALVKAIKVKDILSVSLDYKESFFSGVEKEFTNHIVIKYFNQSKLNKNESKKLRNQLITDSKKNKDFAESFKATTSLSSSLINSLGANKSDSRSDEYGNLLQNGMTAEKIEEHLENNIILLLVPDKIEIVKPALSIHAKYNQNCEYQDESQTISNGKNTERRYSEEMGDKKYYKHTISEEKFLSNKNSKINNKKSNGHSSYSESRVSIGVLHIYTIKEDSMLYGLLKNSYETHQLISAEKAPNEDKRLGSRDVQQIKEAFEEKKKKLLTDPTNHNSLQNVINIIYHYPFLNKLCWKETQLFERLIELMKSLLDLYVSLNKADQSGKEEKMLIYIRKHIIQTLVAIEIVMQDSEYIKGYYINMSTALEAHLGFMLDIVMFDGFCDNSKLNGSKFKEFEENYLIGGIKLLYMLLQNISLLKVLPQSSAPELESICELLFCTKNFNSFIKRLAQITTKLLKQTQRSTKPLYAEIQVTNRTSNLENVSNEHLLTSHHKRYTIPSACLLHRCLSIMVSLMDSDQRVKQSIKKEFSIHLKYFVDISQVLSQLPSTHNIFIKTCSLLTCFYKQMCP